MQIPRYRQPAITFQVYGGKNAEQNEFPHMVMSHFKLAFLRYRNCIVNLIIEGSAEMIRFLKYCSELK